MPLAPGQLLGPYEVTVKLGEGGMGEVWRARDTRLDRDVALKVLPEAFTSDPERLARFEREAKVLASLNHPNIGHIYGLEEADGTQALVLELVEGPTLADRIAEGAIPLDEALAIARQIAEALEAAHERGVIHRDLKPANIKLTPAGTVKVLDFGLAKALEPQTGAVEFSRSPTRSISPPATRRGVILGTAAYMSPEQARGRPVDKRTDVWAFGCVLYEMWTGRRPFAGEDFPETLAAVLHGDIDLELLPADCPPRVGKLIEVCLAPDPEQRIHDMADVRLAMEGAFETTSATPSTSPGGSGLPLWKRRGLLLTALLALVAASSLGVWVATRPEAVPGSVMRFTLVSSDTATAPYRTFGSHPDLAISPDGRSVAYAGSLPDGLPRIHLRPIDQTTGTPLTGGEHGVGPFFSPDGQWVGIYSFGAGGTLSKVSIHGGSPIELIHSPNPIYGASWGRDGRIILGGYQDGLRRISEAGGAPEVLTTPDRAQGEISHSWPSLVSDREAVLFVISSGSFPATGQLAVLELATRDVKRLGIRGTSPRFVSTGHLLYVAENASLRAVPFDARSLTVTGNPVPLVESVRVKASGAADFGLSENGTLVYSPASTGQGRRLVWVDRDGGEKPIPAPPRGYNYARISPDGTKIAADIQDREARIWIWDLATETLTPVTSGPYDIYPSWHPDGRSLLFSSNRDGTFNIYQKAANGVGAAERITDSAYAQAATAVTPDGASVIAQSLVPGRQRDLVVAALDGERPGPERGATRTVVGAPSSLLRGILPSHLTSARRPERKTPKDQGRLEGTAEGTSTRPAPRRLPPGATSAPTAPPWG